MSINFAAISPHPPIIVPGIGKNNDLEKVGSTIAAMRKLSYSLQKAEIETLIVISPHSLVYPDRFNICGMEKVFGSFASFDAPQIDMEFSNDLDLADKIEEISKKNDLATTLYDNSGEFFELDHGIMVPLFYLTQNQETSLKVLPIAYSGLDRSKHFVFGQVIAEAIKSTSTRVGVIASGDLSHRLIQGGPIVTTSGKEFDNKLVNDLKENNTQEILYYDEDLVDMAGECGFRSILILLGILDGKKYNPEILSYEGPFGVGYLVANYDLPESK